MFEPGDKAEHILNKEWVLVMAVKGDTITCRTKSFSVIDFQSYELRKPNK